MRQVMFPSTWRLADVPREVGEIVDDKHNVGTLGEGQ